MRYGGEAIAEWGETGEATAAIATATRPAEADVRQTIRGVSASYSAGQIGTLDITSGGTTLWSGHVHNFRDIPLDLQGLHGEDVTATLSAGSVGVVGRVSIYGFEL